MSDSIIEGLTKQEETLFWGLINKILAQKLLPEASSASTEKQFQLNFKVDNNGSIDVDSIHVKLIAIKPPSRIIPIILYGISFAALTLGFVAIPGIIIWIVTNSVIFTIFALIGLVAVSFLGVGAFFGRINYKWFINISTAYLIAIILVTLLGKFLSL